MQRRMRLQEPMWGSLPVGAAVCPLPPAVQRSSTRQMDGPSLSVASPKPRRGWAPLGTMGRPPAPDVQRRRSSWQMVGPLLLAASRAFRLVLHRMRWHAPQRGWGGGGRGGRSPAPLAGLTRIVRPSSSVEKCERKRSSTWPIRTRTRCSGERNLRRTYSRRLSLENQRPRKWTTFSGQSALTPRRPVRRSSSTRVSSRPFWRDAPMEFCEKRSWLTRSQPRFLGCPPAHSDAGHGGQRRAGHRSTVGTQSRAEGVGLGRPCQRFPTPDP
jgi:hypothetical protein